MHLTETWKKRIRWQVLAAAAALGLLLWQAAAWWLGPLPLAAAVPEHAAVVISLSRRQLVTQVYNNPQASLFVPAEVGGSFSELERLFGGILPPDPGMDWLATVQPTNHGSDVLFVFPGRRGLSLASFLQASFADSQLRETRYRRQRIFHVSSAESTFSLCRYRNLLLVARHAYLVEHAVSQLDKRASIRQRVADFRSLGWDKEADTTAVQLMLNLPEVAGQFTPLLRERMIDSWQSLDRIGTLVHLRWPCTPGTDTWKASARLSTEHPVLAANRSGTVQPYRRVLSLIPDNIPAFAWFSTGPVPTARTATAEAAGSPDWFAGELVSAAGEPLDESTTERFLLLKARDAAAADAGLRPLAAKTEDFQLFQILTLRDESLAAWTGFVPVGGLPFACLVGSDVLLANSKAGMERWLNKYMAGQTLDRQDALAAALPSLPPTANGFLYAESKALWQAAVNHLREDLPGQFPALPVSFDFLAATWHNTVDGAAFEVVSPARQGHLPRAPDLLWSVRLPAAVRTAPRVFTGTKPADTDILVQDDENTLHLLAHTGKIRWRLPLPAPVRSDFFAISLHGDGERQYAFSTADAIYVVGRDGILSPGFPLRLQVPAVNGVTVVDFFQSHDYRFFIACENGNIYGLDEKGTPVEGWRPKSGMGLVTHPLLHFQSDGKDFLVLLDIDGKLSVFQKNGEERFPSIQLEGTFRQGPGVQLAGPFNRIVVCNDAGKAFIVNLQGKHFSLRLADGSEGPVRFLFADVMGDRRKDYLVLTQKAVLGYQYEGKRFFRSMSFLLPNGAEDIFPVRWPGEIAKQEVGMLDVRRERIHLVDGAGLPVPGFPLAGSTSFAVADLFHNQTAVVLTGLGDQVVAYVFED
jgi:hypothetical protein